MQVLTRRFAITSDRQDFELLELDLLFAGAASLRGALELVPRLLMLLENPDAGCEDLAEVIRADADLAESLVKISNSIAYAGALRTCSLLEAILRLGMREVYRLIVQSVTCRALRGKQASGFQQLDLRRHSLATAVAAQTLSQQMAVDDPDVAFTAGLLHDIGKVSVIDKQRAESQWGLGRCEMDGAAYIDEREALNGDHGEAGARLLRNWNFPERVVESVRCHHCPLNATAEDSRSLAALVYTANVLAHRIGEGTGSPTYAAEPDSQTLSTIGLAPADLAHFERETEHAMWSGHGGACNHSDPSQEFAKTLIE